MSTGMPRPSSSTEQLPSGSSVTVICLQWPARCSSTALSTHSQTRWCSAEPSCTSPMYMPGRLRTASSPSSTVMFSEPYVSLAGELSVTTEPSIEAASAACRSVVKVLISYPPSSGFAASQSATGQLAVGLPEGVREYSPQRAARQAVQRLEVSEITAVFSLCQAADQGPPGASSGDLDLAGSEPIVTTLGGQRVGGMKQLRAGRGHEHLAATFAQKRLNGTDARGIELARDIVEQEQRVCASGAFDGVQLTELEAEREDAVLALRGRLA